MTLYDHDDDKTRINTSELVQYENRQDALVQIYPPGPNMGRKWELKVSEMYLGRDQSCNIIVTNGAVSRRHARLSFDGSQRFVADLQSTNGTHVNNIQIDKHKLTQGDQIKIGDAIFKYLVGSDVESAYHEEIYRMTIIDGLTSIYNKRYFLDEIERETARSTRYDRPLSLIMLDIDHFKAINDNYGHLAGDMVLQKLAKSIKERMRRGEIFARYGGEEFAILLPETGPEGALDFAEDIRALVESNAFDYEHSKIPVTVSMGIASIKGEELSIEQFIDRSDKKLYEAKNSGRNCVRS